jgi:hypothetical protein
MYPWGYYSVASREVAISFPMIMYSSMIWENANIPEGSLHCNEYLKVFAWYCSNVIEDCSTSSKTHCPIRIRRYIMLPEKLDLPISLPWGISIGSITLKATPFPMIILSGTTRWKKQLNPRRNSLRDIAIPYEVRKVLIQCIRTIGRETAR